jgi:alpha-mannosidase
MNNYWHTNYKADQEGQVTLRYAVSPHLGSDPVTAKRLGLEASTPLVAVAADPATPAPCFPLTIESDALVAVSLKPAADGKAWILRLYNASGRPETLRLSGEAAGRGRVFLNDVDGTQGAALPASLEVPASGIVTLRIIR